MRANDLARAAVERLSGDQALRGALTDEQFAEILECAVTQIVQAAARGGSDFELSARIKEIVAEVKDEVEAEGLALKSPEKKRPIFHRPEARRS